MGVDRKRICLRDRRGMSLVEMIVAMAIIAVIGGICVSAFTTVLNLETRETDARRASEKAEQQLASGVKATKEETVMISGNASMPNPKSTDYEPSTFDPQRQETWGLDGPVVGNTGGGFVRITLIG